MIPVTASTQARAISRRSFLLATAGLGLLLASRGAHAKNVAVYPLGSDAVGAEAAISELVYVVEEGDVSRIVTPFYSVAVPAALSAGGLSVSYDDAPAVAPDATTQPAHVLRLALGDRTYEVSCQCPSPDDSAGWGSASAAVASSDGKAIRVSSQPAHGGAGRWDEATAAAEGLASFVEPAFARGWALPPLFVVAPAGSSTLVKTPWYVVNLPLSSYPAPVSAAYSEGLPAPYVSAGACESTHSLCLWAGEGVFDVAGHVEVRCLASVDAQVLGGAYHVAPTGRLSADGLQVCVLVPLGAANGDPEALSALRSLADGLASCVSLPGDAPDAYDLAYVEREGSDVRVVTPFYSVRVPVEFAESGVELVSYRDFTVTSGEGSGNYFWHEVAFRAGSEAFTLFCYDPRLNDPASWTGYALSEGLSADGFPVCASVSTKARPETAEELEGMAALMASGVGLPVGVAAATGAPRFLEERLADGSLDIEAPWYRLRLPLHLAPEGLVLSYVDGLPAAYAASDDSFSTHVLYMVAGPDAEVGHVSIRCLGEGAWAEAGSYAVADTGLRSADGLRVCAVVPVSPLYQLAECESLAAEYAACVSLPSLT